MKNIERERELCNGVRAKYRQHRQALASFRDRGEFSLYVRMVLNVFKEERFALEISILTAKDGDLNKKESG